MKRLLFILVLVAVSFSSLSGLAGGKPEILYICGPCSRDFAPVAEKVIQELSLEESVQIKITTCLGACASPPAIEWRKEIYGFMTKEKLASLLKSSFSLS
ncbi:MAG: NAD(P)H-dependent oxidoreductase subunit E [Aminobacterium sp.]|jgi:hypothetical protein|uniref:NAD(P)H-dependent oxidoreductase subunit E n=1 Tax=unclassified Aminobacterium TaxID=2685012 RepID=UPI001BD08129|nr:MULTISPECIES: NAD(P)H-dependent oxidoreductase subunit E [unclassified Aminobacterium]MDD2206644.1 NAD(P)H-dependent oxidoreductase subunit E [Aminobacterium sp.]MDD3425522.1 NAD(P)H-dependent oxidoreductase subunit E [Aminobacterium sp.]MDD3706792.1 NAD(P)H-dependent oxidoreductase subunit E [Aminobacterium sp.]MDD4228609.1 NAD(P)H-dependent oxidoreductase subunit E [Aminobacterium sp.]MDD4551537.1 NAD(P)H-dependent oxidoreductase subunit E [Aminobacterium sp.]